MTKKETRDQQIEFGTVLANECKAMYLHSLNTKAIGPVNDYYDKIIFNVIGKKMYEAGYERIPGSEVVRGEVIKGMTLSPFKFYERYMDDINGKNGAGKIRSALGMLEYFKQFFRKEENGVD